ncbi:MAG: translation initiation factor [Isosphaeraceae bacterium]
MTRLFAGTPWDRPPTCERCGRPEVECQCPPPVAEPRRLDPKAQTARVGVEKRARGKLVTVVSGLDPEGNDLARLAATLKSACGTGGTMKDGQIELQGDHREAVAGRLTDIGYKVKRR